MEISGRPKMSTEATEHAAVLGDLGDGENVLGTLTFALWFWNQTWTTRTVSPVSAASVSLTCKSQQRHTYYHLCQQGIQNTPEFVFPKDQTDVIFTQLEAQWIKCPTFLQGLEDTSKEALKALLCWVLRMVRGRLGRRGSLLSPLPLPAEGHFSDFTSTSSSSLFSVTTRV